MNPGNHLQGLLGDFRFAARSLGRSPGFAATTIVSLALGVALTASTLSITNSYVVRAMPFPNSERLYRALYDSPGQPEPSRTSRLADRCGRTCGQQPSGMWPLVGRSAS